MTYPETSPQALAAPLAYACDQCHTVIFTEDQITGRRPLWDLGEYTSDSYLIARPHDWSALRRYDTSLHQGWYCCRFILMRMTSDKFGTGDSLIVYADSVHPVPSGIPAPTAAPRAVRRLTGQDFDRVLTSAEHAGRLAMVKLGAIWCPPCRLMDAAICRIIAAGGIDGVDFYEVDIDEQPDLAARFPSQTIPYTLLWHDGRRLTISSTRMPTLDGGIVGAIGQTALTSLLTQARRQAVEGTTLVEF